MASHSVLYPVLAKMSAHAWGNVYAGRPALFLDRDGIVNIDTGYLRAANEVVVQAPTIEAIREANSLSIPVVVVSNQSGVGRGFFGWDAVTAVDDRIAEILWECRVTVDLVIYAGADPNAEDYDPFRKPNPGMFHLAARMLLVDLGRSWMIGDKQSDMEAARRADLAGGVLIGKNLNGEISLGNTDRKSSKFYALGFEELATGFGFILNELGRGSAMAPVAASRLDAGGNGG